MFVVRSGAAMICSRCNTANAGDATLCENCGLELSTAKRKTRVEDDGDPDVYKPPSNARRRTVAEDDGGAFASALGPQHAKPARAPKVDDPFAASVAPRSPEGRPRERTRFDAASALDAASPAEGGRRVIGWLVTFDGDADGKVFLLREGRNTIGRDPASDVSRADQRMSGRHACIQYRGGRTWLFDEGSNNGTFLDGEDIFQNRPDLRDGAEVRCGATRFIVKLLDMDRVERLFFAKGS
jgi:ribosomal protein L40E